jgi:murein DD-endopeptidase MepM/ murein hydrolase activator NlpD
MRVKLRSLLFVLLLASCAASFGAEKFHLPTANQAIFKPNEQEKYFVGTTDKPWTSGTFGCVRSGGWQMHEGLDVRCIQRDKQGEPLDPVLATADGKVAYINKRPSLSNYGNYVILQHFIDGMEIYSLYAHLSEVRDGLKIGQPVRSGEPIATMGRTSNTHERISKERAHVHFELDFFVTERFSNWYKKNFPTTHNDHGLWNGQNMIGVDPREVLLLSHRLNEKFNLVAWIQTQKELCRVVVRKTDFPWLKRYAPLVRRNPVAEKEGVAGYELALNFNGLPFQALPLAASQIRSKAKYQLISVNESEYNQCPCRKLVTRKGKSWDLANNGIRFLDLLTY